MKPITVRDFYKGSEREKRISVDIDNKDSTKFRALHVFFAMKNAFPTCKVSMDRSGHGFHVKAVGNDIKKIPLAKRIEIRDKLCDDHYRIECDRRKIEDGLEHWADTLFCMKQGFNDKLRIVEAMDPVALPFASRIPAKKPNG
jgi:hypothetical protein